MITKSIRLTDDEAAGLHELVGATGEVEASVLKRAALRGLRAMRLEQGILVYLERRDSYEASRIAGLPRAALLWELGERGIVLGDGDPIEFLDGLAELAESFSDERLKAALEAGREEANPA